MGTLYRLTSYQLWSGTSGPVASASMSRTNPKDETLVLGTLLVLCVNLALAFMNGLGWSLTVLPSFFLILSPSQTTSDLQIRGHSPFTSALHPSLDNVIHWTWFRGAPSGLGNSGISSVFIGPKTQRFRSSGSFPLSLFIFWLSWNLKSGTLTSRYQACWQSIPNLKGRFGKPSCLAPEPTMGSKLSIPKDISLVWLQANLKELRLGDLRLATVIWLSVQIWPQYILDNGHCWPEFGTFWFQYLKRFKQLHQTKWRVVQGFPIYEPRKHSTTPGFSS